MDVSRKSLGVLIDDLCTTSQKIFQLQEGLDSLSDEELGIRFKKIQTLNVRRNALINAIDSISSSDIASTTDKTYK